MLIGMIFSRLLSPADYGDYRQVWLIFRTVAPFLVLGLDSSIIFFLPQLEKSRHRVLLMQTVGMLGGLGILFSVVLFFGSEAISEFYGSNLNQYLKAIALYPVFFFPFRIAPLWLVATERVQVAAILSILSEVARAVGAVGLVISTGNLTAVFLWASITALGSFLLMVWLIRRTYPGYSRRPDWKLLRSQWSYSLPLGIATVLGSTLKRLSANFVAVAFTAGTFAVYANGAFELPIIHPLSNAVMVVILPEFVRLGNTQKYDKLLRLWLESIRKLSIYVYPSSVFFFQFALPTIVLLFSEKYADSAAVFRIFLLVVPLRIAQYGAILKAMNRTSWILGTNIVSLVITLVLSVALISPLGIYGPALATVIGIYTLAILSLILLSRLLTVTFWQVYPWTDLLKVMGVSILAAVPTQLLIIPRHWPEFTLLLVGAVVYGFGYLSLGLLTGIIRRSDFDFILEIIQLKQFNIKK